MRILLLVLSFVFLGIVAPVFLIAIASPWQFSNILLGWSLLALVVYPLWWVMMGRKQLV
jgi:hypothetical protein